MRQIELGIVPIYGQVTVTAQSSDVDPQTDLPVYAFNGNLDNVDTNDHTLYVNGVSAM